MKGCAKLFELRGPKAYASEFEHHLFLTFRYLEVGASTDACVSPGTDNEIDPTSYG